MGCRLLCFFAILAIAPVATAEQVVEIVVRENTKTTRDTVLLIADLETGDDWSTEVADTVEKKLVSSGLFKQVDVWWDPAPGGVRVNILAKDKHSWVIAPTFYNQPTNKGGGVGFGENNLFGENKKLLLYAQGATGDTFFVGAYVDPSLFGSRFRWQIDTFLKSGRIIEYAPPDELRDDPKPLRISRLNYLNGGLRLGVNLFLGAALDARIRGARVSYGYRLLADDATSPEVTGDPTSTNVPRPGKEGWDVSTEVTFSVDTRANWYGLSQGTKLSVTWEQGQPALGSDFDYWLVNIYAERARRVFERHNFVARINLGYGHDLPFQQEFTVGGTAMRGYKNAQFRGDLRASANLEYSVPLFTIKGVSFRALTFADSAYITFVDTANDAPFRHHLPGSEATGLAPFKNTVGLGTRLYMRQIVLPLLGLDFGYGLERGAYEIYLAIGLTD